MGFVRVRRSIREMLASVEAFRNGNTQSAEQSFSPISPAASEGRLSAEPSSAAGTGGGGSGGAATMSGFSSGGPSGGSGGASGAPMQQSSQQGAASNDPFNMLGSLTGSLREPSGSVQPVGSLADLDFGSSASAAGREPLYSNTLLTCNGGVGSALGSRPILGRHFGSRLFPGDRARVSRVPRGDSPRAPARCRHVMLSHRTAFTALTCLCILTYVSLASRIWMCTLCYPPDAPY